MNAFFEKCFSLVLVSCFFFQAEAWATSAPSNLVATGESSSQINLTWTDNSGSETGYTFAYDTNSGLTSPTYTYAGGANTTSYSHTGRSAATTYYYFQMVAQNFRGSSVAVTDNQANVKTFGAEDVDQTAVMIMNQDQSSSFNYTVRLDTGTVSGLNPLKINVDAGVAAEYNGTISTESSIVLIFDASGAIKKKIEYKLNGHANSNLPPAVTTY